MKKAIRNGFVSDSLIRKIQKEEEMKIFEKIGDGITALNEKVAAIASFLIFPLIIVETIEVFFRYVLNSPTIYTYDLSWMFYAALVFLGGGYALEHEVHVRADVFFNMLSERGKAILSIICYIIFFFTSMIGIIWSTWDLMIKAFVYNETSPYTSWNPSVAPIKTVLFISMVLLALQGIVKFCEYVKVLKKGKSADNGGEE